MSDAESSVQFVEEDDDGDTVDFHTDVDNQSFASRGVRQSFHLNRPGSPSGARRTAKHGSSAALSNVPDTASGSEEDDGSVGPARPPLVVPVTAAAETKKTVVSATLRARAAAKVNPTRGRIATNNATPDSSAPSPQTVSQRISAPAPGHADPAPPSATTPPPPPQQSPYSATLDPAGIAQLMQMVAAQQGDAAALGKKKSSGEETPFPSAVETRVDSGHPEDRHPAAVNKAAALAAARARRIALSNDIVAAAPPSELAPDAQAEAARITLDWYRDFNVEQKKQLHDLQQQVQAERLTLKHEIDSAGTRQGPPSRRPAEVPEGSKQGAKAVPVDPQRRAKVPAPPEKRPIADPSRSASAKGAHRHAAAASRPNTVLPTAIDSSLEIVIRGVASRYGVILPAHGLTTTAGAGRRSEADVCLPDRLFFATGVQLTREQREELIAKIHNALRVKADGASLAEAVGPAPWLTPTETELGSRSQSRQRVVQDNKTRIICGGPSRRTSSPTAALGSNGPAAPTDWVPLTRRDDTAVTRQGSVRRPRKRTEVLRDIFLMLDVRQRRVLRRLELELLLETLTNPTDDAHRIYDELRYSSADSRQRRDAMLRFVTELILPLLLLTGFEEFDFPLFSQIVLRVADRDMLASDFAFQPAAQSPLAVRSRKGDFEAELDTAGAAEAVRRSLIELCAP